jgi:hypothetical protein
MHLRNFIQQGNQMNPNLVATREAQEGGDKKIGRLLLFFVDKKI